MNWRKVLLPFLDDIVLQRDIHRRAYSLSRFYNLPLDRQIKSQRQRLIKLLKHAGEHVPYYQHILKDGGVIDSKGNVHLEKFCHIPYLKKDILRENFEDLKSDDLMKRCFKLNASGGSTGEPVRLIQDKYYSQLSKATQLHNLSSIGYNVGDSYVQLWGSERDIRNETQGLQSRISVFLRNHIILNCFAMSPSDMGQYVEIINKRKPKILHGYADGLYELAKHINLNGLKVSNVGSVISSAGTLYQFMRDEMREAFSCQVYNHYGTREVSGIAFEDLNLNVLRVNNYTQLVEVIDENGNPCGIGEEGEIVVTNLCNYSMPLIRYKIGDRGIVGHISSNDSIRTVLSLTQITGRMIEVFVKADGTVISPVFFIHFLGVVHNEGWIRKSQVIQEDFDKITLKLVVANMPSEDQLNQIRQTIQLAMGEGCHIGFEFVDDIPPTSSGKYLYIQSLVTHL